jgi:hypothetical protein
MRSVSEFKSEIVAFENRQELEENDFRDELILETVDRYNVKYRPQNKGHLS